MLLILRDIDVRSAIYRNTLRGNDAIIILSIFYKNVFIKIFIQKYKDDHDRPTDVA